MSTLITRGEGWLVVSNTRRKKRCAADASRFAVRRKSIVWPVESTIQILPLPLDLDGGFLHPLGLIRRAQKRSTALVEFRCVPRHPAKHAAGVNRPPAFWDQLSDRPITERKIQLPTDTGQDNVCFVMSPVKRVLRSDRHRSSFYRIDHLESSQHNHSFSLTS